MEGREDGERERKGMGGKVGRGTNPGANCWAVAEEDEGNDSENEGNAAGQERRPLCSRGRERQRTEPDEGRESETHLISDARVEVIGEEREDSSAAVSGEAHPADGRRSVDGVAAAGESVSTDLRLSAEIQMAKEAKERGRTRPNTRKRRGRC